MVRCWNYHDETNQIFPYFTSAVPILHIQRALNSASSLKSNQTRNQNPKTRYTHTDSRTMQSSQKNSRAQFLFKDLAKFTSLLFRLWVL